MITNINDNYCNNCGKFGHYYHHCKVPITSIGIIVFRICEENSSSNCIKNIEYNDLKNKKIEYLMICRKDTLGYIDFMRGKYSIYNKEYIMNMIKQMTDDEKNVIRLKDFNAAWKRIWGNESISNQYKTEELTSKEKFNLLKEGVFNTREFYTLDSLIEESYTYDRWLEPEWGFPKGRRNFQEKDYECAFREFTEETGYHYKYLKNIRNLLPFEEIFTGSNYKSYKHKYYLTFMDYNHSLNMNYFDKSEVSKIEWKSFENCVSSIRNYNLEKIRLITNVNNTLNSLKLVY
jgi:ADP-ribose pyrophosphatase YjhB (NUDIX family)